MFRVMLNSARRAFQVESLRNLCVLDKMLVCRYCLGLASDDHRELQDGRGDASISSTGQAGAGPA